MDDSVLVQVNEAFEYLRHIDSNSTLFKSSEACVAVLQAALRSIVKINTKLLVDYFAPDVLYNVGMVKLL